MPNTDYTSLEYRRNLILSNDYADIIIPHTSLSEAEFLEMYLAEGAQILGRRYGMVHSPLSLTNDAFIRQVGYSGVPSLFTPLNTTSLEASGIISVQNQPVLSLKGQNIMIGFVDTGIDFTHPAFRTGDGRTRLAGIWDQTDQGGTPPVDMYYGTEYTPEDINAALSLDDPRELIPMEDPTGHGTFMAGVAGGSPNPEEDFIGAAPECTLAVVKLKPAKQYLKDFFFVPPESEVYQETDILMGINYLMRLAEQNRMPLVLCIGLGSNQGDHAGNDPLSSVLSGYTSLPGCYGCIAAGNEAGKGHHYFGKLDRADEVRRVEILVDDSTEGFSLEFWAQAPELYSISLTSPLGETVPIIQARPGQNATYSFLLERTTVYVYYELVEIKSGSQLILIRFRLPTEGIWTISIHNNVYTEGSFNIWLPASGMISPGTVFLAPNPDTTITAPSASASSISVCTYNAYNNSLFINSSRGFTRTGGIKPDLAAPGVDVYGPVPGGRYSTRTGSSTAAAITAGAVALLVEWGTKRPLPSILTPIAVKNYLIRGATRFPNLTYPNKEWGYGTLNVYQIFESLM